MASDHHLSAAELGLGGDLHADGAQRSRLSRLRVCLLGEGNRLERRHVGPLIVGFVHFDVSMMAWVMMGALGVFIARDLRLGPAQSALLVAVPALVAVVWLTVVVIYGRRWHQRDLSDYVTRRAGRDQSKAPRSPRHPSDGQRSTDTDRADGVDQPSSRQLSQTVDSAPARRRGRRDVAPGPAVSSGRAGPSRQGKRRKLLDSTSRLRPGCILAVMLLMACGAAHDRSEGVPSAAGAARGFPTFPGATWDGDITSQERDGQLVWVVSWSAPSAKAQVRRFFVRILSPSGWQFGQGESINELTLRREDPKLRGYLRFGQPKAGETGTGVTLGIRDPRPRKNRCLEALPGLPQYPGAEVRGCDLVHVPGSRSLSVLAATGDDVALADKTLGRVLSSLGWTSEPAILGALVFRQRGGAGETARVIWGPDPFGRLPTAFMLSIDLPEAALSELPQ